MTSSFVLLASALAPAAHAQARSSAPGEIGARIGLVRHELAGHTAIHPTLGVEALPLRVGAVRVGLGVEGWLDRISLGSTFGDRAVHARYVLYGVSMEASGGRSFVNAAAGAETVFFGERYEAASLFPRSSTGPQASLGIGTRLPLPRSGSPWSVRVEGRGYVTYPEVFDPTGVEEGREVTLMPAVYVRLNRALR